MTKPQLVSLISKLTNVNKQDAKALVTLVFELVATSLVRGTDVNISGFGRFTMRKKRGVVSRIRDNPEKLGNEYFYKQITFTPAQRLKKIAYTGHRYRKR